MIEKRFFAPQVDLNQPSPDKRKMRVSPLVYVSYLTPRDLEDQSNLSIALALNERAVRDVWNAIYGDLLIQARAARESLDSQLGGAEQYPESRFDLSEFNKLLKMLEPVTFAEAVTAQRQYEEESNAGNP